MIVFKFEGETIAETVNKMLDFIHNNVSDASYFEKFTQPKTGELAHDEGAKVDKEAAPAPEPAPADDTAEVPDISKVRKVVSAWARSNGTDKLKELLASFNASSLTDLDPQHYNALLEKVAA